MTIRDVSADFGFVPQTSSSAQVVTTSIVGGPNLYLGINSFDAGPFGSYLTEFSPNDQLLTCGGQTFFVESGAGQGLKLVVDWTTAPVGSGTIHTELITSASSTMSAPLVMIDFGALPIAMFFQGYRQIESLPRSASWQRFLGLQILTSATTSAGACVSWLGIDIDSVIPGYAEGFSIK